MAMNIIEKLNENPVLLYGVAGVLAGNMLGGGQKERTNSAVLYGALGAAVGWFVSKGNKQAQGAAVSKVVAAEAAATAEKAADVAEAASEAAKAGWGGYGIPRRMRPPRGTRAYRHARRMLMEQQSQQNDAMAQLAGIGAL